MGSVFFENHAFFFPNVTLCSTHIFKNECSGFKEGLNKIDNVILSRYKKKKKKKPTFSYLMGYSTSLAVIIIYYYGI